MNAQRRVLTFRRIALIGAVLAATVIVLGAWVRLTNAGLGCPDWPGCYGHLYPQPEAEVGKAWHEMIHRYVATTLGFIITLLLAWSLWRRKDPDQPLIPVVMLFVVVCFQGMLGALTVTQLLKPLIVTGHLIGGLTTLSLLCWLSITPHWEALTARETGLRRFALLACGALCLQLFLGGWTSTNYAALACPDFPMCQRAWWPAAMDFHDAFALQGPPNVDYEGGVLSNSARMAIQVTHRLGAVVVGTLLIVLGMLAARSRNRRVAGAGMGVTAAVLFQISMGISTVHFGVPLSLATMHNAGAALLVISMVWLMRALWPRAMIGMVPLRRGNRTE